MKHFLSIILLLLFSACKLTQSNIIGRYELPTGVRTELIIDSNNNFYFSKFNGISALLKNENFITTSGIWTMITDRKLILQSNLDPSEHLAFKIQEDSAREGGITGFTFLDINGDTLRISIYDHNNRFFGKVHSSYSRIKIKVAKGDSLSFNFPGYRQWKLVKDNYRNSDYRITLFPEYVSSYFNQTEFQIKHNSLIEISNNTKFKKSNR